MGKSIDWRGLRFGRLTVVGDDPTYKYRVICQCDCGKITRVFKSNLRTGNTRSCGCYKKEQAYERGKALGAALGEHFREHRELNRRFNTNFGTIERKTPQANNTSGHTGVSFVRRDGKYTANIGVNGQLKHLGMFSKYKDAVAAREKAEKEYFEPLIEAKNEYLESKDETTRAQKEYEKWKHLASYMR